MAKGLVIVESPAKAKTIQKYLGRGYEVEASLGHVKDLPKSDLGVDVDNNFETEYLVIPGKEKVLAKLKKLAKDRRCHLPGPRPGPRGRSHRVAPGRRNSATAAPRARRGAAQHIVRVSFNEITKRAVQEAFRHPREIDQNLVDAQQTRRVLDRIVGYQVSPLLWDKVRRGLSAGRVQTVALRLIVEREREIKAFETVEYWTLDAHLLAAEASGIRRRVWSATNEKLNVLPNEEAAKLLEAALQNAAWTVRSVEKRETPAQRGRAVHHQQIPAGRLAQAGHEREARDDARATAL